LVSEKLDMKQESKTSKAEWLFTFIFVLVLIYVHVELYQYGFDDAYIHFRVARNLVEMHAPYFNALEALKVSTSSGWVIFLAIIYALVKTINLESSYPIFIAILNALITTGVAVVYSRFVEILHGKRLSALQKLTLQSITIVLLLPSSIGLMETPFALLTAGLGLYLISLEKPSGFIILGFAVYLRLELTVLLVLLCIFAIFVKKFPFHQVIGYSIIGVIPFVFFDLIFYQTIVPHSIIAKSQIYSLTPINTLIDVLFKSMPSTSIPPLVVGVSLITLVVVILWIIIKEIVKDRTSNYPALFYFSGVLIACAYIAGHSLLFDWYIPLYMLPIVVSLFLYLSKYPKHKILGALHFVLLLFSVISIGRTIYSTSYKFNHFVLFESGSRVKVYLSIGKIINEDYPNATLLTSEIGGLGYSFHGKIFDAAGLASSNSLFFHPMNVPHDRSSGYLGAIPPSYVRLANPDIIVSYDVFAEALLRDTVSTQYNIVTLPAFLPEDAKYSESQIIWGSKYIRIYIRKSLPVSSKICAMAIISKETPNKACT